MSRVHVVALGRGNIYANFLGRFNAVDTGRDFIAAVAGLVCVMCDVWADFWINTFTASRTTPCVPWMYLPLLSPRVNVLTYCILSI